MKKSIYFLVLILIAFTADSYSSHHEIYRELSTKASHSLNFLSAEEGYGKGISYRNGKEEHPKDSLQSVIYASVCFEKASSLYRKENNVEGFQKSIHNLAMLRLRMGDIAWAKNLFESIPTFIPSKKNLELIQAALTSGPNDLNPFISASSLPDNLRKTLPYGLIHKDWSEHVYASLLTKGVVPLELTDQELNFFKLTPLELRDLEVISSQIEEITNNSEKPCLVMLGRSPILVGMMLKVRNKCKGEVVNVPFSGIKTLGYFAKDKACVHGFLEFLNAKLPLNFKNYFVIDMYQTGQSFEVFGTLNKNRISRDHLFGLALRASDETLVKNSSPYYSQIMSLPVTQNLLLKTVKKEVFDRAYILPGKSLYPKDWNNKEYLSTLISYDPFQRSLTLIGEIYWEQMIRYNLGKQN